MGPALDVSLCGLCPCGLHRNLHKNSISCTSAKKRFRQALQVLNRLLLLHSLHSHNLFEMWSRFPLHSLHSWHSWLTGLDYREMEWGTLTAMTSVRKGRSAEREHLQSFITFICPRRGLRGLFLLSAPPSFTCTLCDHLGAEQLTCPF